MHSPSISALNELAAGDFSQNVPVIQSPVLGKILSSQRLIGQLPTIYRRTRELSTLVPFLHPLSNPPKVLDCVLLEIYVLPHPTTFPASNEFPEVDMLFGSISKAWSILLFIYLSQGNGHN
jgi:hypothetical protein